MNFFNRLTQDRLMHRALPRTLAAFFALAILSWSVNAAAIDGYKDRRGIFVGVGLGGGLGAVDVDEANVRTGFEEGGELGLHLSGIVGGGWTKNIIFGTEMNWWIRTTQVGDQSLNHQHLSFNAVTNVFILSGLYAEAGLGLAYAIFDTSIPGGMRHYREMGMAAKLGAGFEYFINGTVAPGFHVGYTRHFYQRAEFDTFMAGVTLRWY
ncbi:MAG: outer membrane beta-barrel protein [Bradymonadaceae bacterium]